MLSSVPTLIRIVKMDADNATLAHTLPTAFFAVVLFFFGIPLAHGQAYQGGSIAGEGGQNEPTLSTDLPDWAEPSNSSTDLSNKPEPTNRPGTVQNEVVTKAPDPGGQPQVPVDGGLAWLTAAGVGYAVRKLNQEDEEESD
jgi:hypothetical protein